MSDQGFPKSKRLLKQSEFTSTMQSGKKLVDRRLVVIFRPNGEGMFRVGVIASKKVGCAVERNRAKRMIREAFRRMECPSDGAFDIVVVARKSLCLATQNDVSESLRKIVDRISHRHCNANGN